MNSWKPVRFAKAAGIAGTLAVVGWLRQSNPDHWVGILDDANLIFHEAGHPLFGLFGSTLGLYGGTLGQLAFPGITSFHFYREGETASFALCLAWLFENFLNIGRYMGDARAQILPLVGGGEHDWATIFSRWGVLAHDVKIGGCVQGLGWLGMAACAVWLLARAVGDDRSQ